LPRCVSRRCALAASRINSHYSLFSVCSLTGPDFSRTGSCGSMPLWAHLIQAAGTPAFSYHFLPLHVLRSSFGQLCFISGSCLLYLLVIPVPHVSLLFMPPYSIHCGLPIPHSSPATATPTDPAELYPTTLALCPIVLPFRQHLPSFAICVLITFAVPPGYSLKHFTACLHLHSFLVKSGIYCLFALS